MIFPSVARLAAAGAIFLFHYLGLLGLYRYRLDFLAILIFCFLSGYLANVRKTSRLAWLIRRYLGILIPYWLVIVPVIIINQVTQYKTVSLASQAITILGGNLFLENPLYVIGWYVTFVLLLYAYAFIEDFGERAYVLFCMVIGALLFFFWLDKGFYFIAFVVGLRLSGRHPLRKIGIWFATKRSEGHQIATVLFVSQQYAYPFYLIHGPVLLLFFKKTTFSASSMFWLALLSSTTLAVVLRMLSKPIHTIVLNKALTPIKNAQA